MIAVVLKSDNANGLLGFVGTYIPSTIDMLDGSIACPVERRKGAYDSVTLSWMVVRNASEITSLPTNEFVNVTGAVVFPPGERLTVSITRLPKSIFTTYLNNQLKNLEMIHFKHLWLSWLSTGIFVWCNFPTIVLILKQPWILLKSVYVSNNKLYAIYIQYVQIYLYLRIACIQENINQRQTLKHFIAECYY